MSDKVDLGNCLVIGKAKTGTTALAHLLQVHTGASVLHMEPKGIMDFVSLLPEDGNYVTKIIFEHFRGRYRHLNAILHNELYARYDKIIFIRRDIRDEMVSRLLYLSKVISHADHSDDAWRAWIDTLRRKEQAPRSCSFRQMCKQFQSCFGHDAWSDITGLHTDTELEFNNFISGAVRRNYAVIQYEDMVDNRLDAIENLLGDKISLNVEDIELGNFAYTRRSGTYGGWKCFFLEQDVEDIRLILERKGLNRFDDWTLETSAQLNPADFSQYVQRMSNRPESIFS